MTLHSTALFFVPVTAAIATSDPPTGTAESERAEMLTAKPDLEGLGARSLLSLAGSGVTSSPVFAGNAPDIDRVFSAITNPFQIASIFLSIVSD